MNTQHFNGLTEYEAELLALLAEECGEVVLAVCKILRHGYESHNPTLENRETNRDALERELGDLANAIDLMQSGGDIDRERIESFRVLKSTRIAPYLHHWEKLRT